MTTPIGPPGDEPDDSQEMQCASLPCPLPIDVPAALRRGGGRTTDIVGNTLDLCYRQFVRCPKIKRRTADLASQQWPQLLFTGDSLNTGRSPRRPPHTRPPRSLSLKSKPCVHLFGPVAGVQKTPYHGGCVVTDVSRRTRRAHGQAAVPPAFLPALTEPHKPPRWTLI